MFIVKVNVKQMSFILYKSKTLLCSVSRRKCICSILNYKVFINHRIGIVLRVQCFSTKPRINIVNDYFQNNMNSNQMKDDLLKCQTSREVMNVLSQISNTNDMSVYSTAIKKCSDLKDIQNCKIIFKMVIENHSQMNIYLYNALFLAFTENDSIWECNAYLKQMMGKYNLMPDSATASILLKGCKCRGNINQARKIWKDVILKYDIPLTNYMLVELISIYGKFGEIEKAEKIFNRCLSSSESITICNYMCGAMINAYAKNNQIEKALAIQTYAANENLELSVIEILPIMSFYLKTENALFYNPSKTLQLCMEYDHEPYVNGLFHLKSVAYLHLLRKEIEQQMKVCNDQNSNLVQYYFSMIVNSMMEERAKYGISESEFAFIHVRLRAFLYYYRYEFDHKCLVEYYQKLCEHGHIQHWTKLKQNNTLSVLDLHNFGYEIAHFLLLYVLKYETKKILNLEQILIVCGKRTHINPHVSGEGLLKFVQGLLQNTFHPSIRCSLYKTPNSRRNKGILLLNKNDVENYCKFHQYLFMNNDRL